MTTIRISAAHRDALYEHIVYRLSGIADLYQAVEEEDFARANRLGWEYSDFLRFVLDDLQWGDGPGRSIELTSPPDVLERVLKHLRELAIGLQEDEAEEQAEMRRHEERNELVIEACDQALGELDDERAA